MQKLHLNLLPDFRDAAFEAVSASDQYCSTPLLKVERSMSDLSF